MVGKLSLHRHVYVFGMHSEGQRLMQNVRNDDNSKRYLVIVFARQRDPITIMGKLGVSGMF